jgi:excisionase family DNA binding protein
MQHATVTAAPNDLLTAQDVATMLGVTTGWVYAQSRKGRIPTITLGRYRRYRRDAILHWLDQIERPHAQHPSAPRPRLSAWAPSADTEPGTSTSSTAPTTAAGGPATAGDSTVALGRTRSASSVSENALANRPQRASRRRWQASSSATAPRGCTSGGAGRAAALRAGDLWHYRRR